MNSDGTVPFSFCVPVLLALVAFTASLFSAIIFVIWLPESKSFILPFFQRSILFESPPIQGGYN